MNYWAKRIQKEHDTLHKASLTDLQRQYVKMYQAALRDIQRDVKDLYDKILKDSADGKIRMNDYYKYNRYFQLQNRLNQRLTELGAENIKITEEKLLKMYDVSWKLVGEEAREYFGVDLIADNDDAAKKAINAIWCNDGKLWSARVWTNMEQLQQRVEKGLMDSIARGVSKDELVKQLIKDFNTEFYKADRIARTELTYVQNKSASDRYMKSGIKQYEYLAALDDRTSEQCQKLNGKKFDFANAKIGENMPPVHANCRCTILPVL